MTTTDDPPEKRSTQVVHAGDRVHAQPSVTWPIAPPIVQTSVYAYPDIATVDGVHDGGVEGYIYGGYGVPNQHALEVALAELEGGEAAIVTTSGSNAIATVLLGLTGAGQSVVAAINAYGGTRALLDLQLSRFGVTTRYVHPADLDAVRATLASDPRPALLWADTIANPTILTTDISALAELAHSAGVPLVIDNTFATPIHCHPLRHGAAIVVHSTTKFIGGHNDSRGGAVVADSETIERLRRVAIQFGAIGRRSRRGSSCAGCVRSMCAWRDPARTRWPLRGRPLVTRLCIACITPVSTAIPDTRSHCERSRAASAACSRST